MLFDPWVLRARALLNAGLYDDARSLLHTMITERGRDHKLLQELAAIETASGNYLVAIDLCREVLAATDIGSADYPQAFFALTFQLFEGKLFDEAKQNLQQILAHDPQNMGARFLVAQILINEENFPQANKILLNLVAESPENTDFRFNLGNSFHLMAAYSTAAAEFRKILDHEPDHIECLAALGYALSRDGQFAEGIGYLRRANELAPIVTKSLPIWSRPCAMPVTMSTPWPNWISKKSIATKTPNFGCNGHRHTAISTKLPRP